MPPCLRCEQPLPVKLPLFCARPRFATSLISTWLLNLNMFGFSLMSICAPGFNCDGCLWATAACPIGVMTFGSAMHAIPVFAIASVLAFAAILGRLLCSFVCPFGLIQDLLHRIPSPKIRLPRFFRYGKYVTMLAFVLVLPYLLGFEHAGFLAVAKPKIDKSKIDPSAIEVVATVQNLGGMPVKSPQLIVSYKEKGTGKEILNQTQSFPDVTVAPGEPAELPAFTLSNYLSGADLVVDSPQSVVNQWPRYQLYYCKLCPADTLTANVPSYFSAKAASPFYRKMTGDWLRISILIVFLVLMVIASRPVCRLFCPLGAIYALTARVSLSRMKLNKDQCTECGQCDKVCPMGLNVRKEVGGMECIARGDCTKVCPKGGIRRQHGI